MITLGVDAHKKLHVATELDETGHEIGQWRGPNSDAGWQNALRWAIALGAPHQWGIVGAWGYGRGSHNTWSPAESPSTKSTLAGPRSGEDTHVVQARPIRKMHELWRCSSCRRHPTCRGLAPRT